MFRLCMLQDRLEENRHMLNTGKTGETPQSGPPPRTTKEYRDQIVKEMLAFHQSKFDLLKVTAAHFYPKVVFNWKGTDCIAMFERELCSPAFYTELVNEVYHSLDTTKRTMYVWRGSEEKKAEYYCNQTPNFTQWFVPKDELEEINVTSAAIASAPVAQSLDEIVLDGTKDDVNFHQATLRDMYAIIQNKPVSNRAWVNKMITGNE